MVGNLATRLHRPLYGEFFGLSEAPFDLTPNPRFLFLSPRQREALSNLRYAFATAKGFTLILGDAGTGKTTLVRTALGELAEARSKYVLLNNPTLSRDEFYEFLAAQFGLTSAFGGSKSRFLTALEADVEARYASGGLTGLIVDEAQSLPHELLEEIRLLGNIETASTKLLNIVLCGQPELAPRLNEQSLRQLKQRIALRCELHPFSLEETAAYISGRLRIAGGDPRTIFTRETVTAIHEGSKGVPRTINVLADNSLIGGFAAQARPVGVDLVRDVCRDFDLLAVAPPAGDGATAPGVSNSEPPVNPHRGSEPPVDRPMFSSIAPVAKRRFSFFS